ncbi:two-component system chemotaxis response regulator CheB [Clostridium punense]|uniref:Protein-glutamate methylesterase/protein-glutamine glutaminase n=2 Tax=Clostridium punense TaxID=1054297 RepID=A0ABS4K7C8_9CLOT|nr:chemotaxis response regulator protein-glutamate methylesterase [Clostridium sp. BL8]EQB87234.1 hypothetical protein M918_10285 [Clostridium sp. BL8]MBP2023680.1 two-component system chemotaxis response regulator CheB [Clostridium punense]
MVIERRIKVLIVDDSMFFREVMARGLGSDPYIQIIATAQDPFEARDKILKYEPDVITCDIEMPKMNGIEFIKRLLPQYPIPVIVVSTISEAVFDAMRVGAVDFISKPSSSSVTAIEKFLYELIEKIKIASQAQLQENLYSLSNMKSIDNIKVGSDKIVAIGASTGGTEAIYSILKQLPKDFPGIVITQHIPPVFSRMFAERLNAQTELYCKEAHNGDYIEQGKVLIAPGDQHMRVKKFGDKYKVEVFSGDKVNGHCPSVDVLFESMAKELGPRGVGIILTGMGYDGAKGLLNLRRKGGRTIGQDEKSSVVYGMPKAAFNIGAVEKQCTLENLPKALYSMIRE